MDPRDVCRTVVIGVALNWPGKDTRSSDKEEEDSREPARKHGEDAYLPRSCGLSRSTGTDPTALSRQEQQQKPHVAEILLAFPFCAREIRSQHVLNPEQEVILLREVGDLHEYIEISIALEGFRVETPQVLRVSFAGELVWMESRWTVGRVELQVREHHPARERNLNDWYDRATWASSCLRPMQT